MVGFFNIDLLGLIGTATGFSALIISYWTYSMNTQKLEVKVRDRPPSLSITAVNSGNRPITLNRAGFLLPDGGKNDNTYCYISMCTNRN